MKNSTGTSTGTPPRLFPTLLKGFNTIANQWYLILFPIVVDLFLWLGPKLRIKALLTPVVSTMMKSMMELSPVELQDTVTSTQKLWTQFLNQYNLFTALHTFPVGVPSIIARQSPIVSPLQQNWIYEAISIRGVVAIIGVLLLVGFFLGCLYFLLIARVTTTENEKITFKELINTYVQTLIMFCLFVGVLTLISIPLMLLLSVLSLISLGVGQLFTLMAIFSSLWLVMPLIFAPHGVFVLKQKALPSMLISVRMVRLFLPGTGLFVMFSVLINEGLNLLWTVPEPNSWLTLLGIGGHSFIITGLLAASFIYYREGLQWMQQNLQRMAEDTKKPQENGGTTLE